MNHLAAYAPISDDAASPAEKHSRRLSNDAVSHLNLIIEQHQRLTRHVGDRRYICLKAKRLFDIAARAAV